MHSLSALAALLVTLAAPGFAPAGEKAAWPQFLGPQRNGVSTETGLNLDWNAKPPKVLWKAPLGNGFSSLAVVGDKLYTMTQRGQREMVVCLDARTGKEIWAYDAAPSYIDRQKQGAGPRGTPTYRAGKLYCLLPMGELICLEAEKGKRVWQANTFQAADATNPAGEWFYWGVSQSPLVHDDLVVVQPGGSNSGSVAAFRTDTGAKVWTAGSDPICYSSPIAITVAGQKQIVCLTGSSVLGVDPGKGTVLWRYPFGNKFNATCSNPVWVEPVLIVSAAYGGGVAAIEPVQKAGGWQVVEKWKSTRNLQSLWATSIVQDGYVYGCSGDLGAILLRCLDLKTGDVKWTQRLAARSSLLAAEGHLLILDERGSLQLVQMNPQQYIAKGSLPDVLAYKAWAAPALADGRLYLRDQRNVLCLDLRRP